MNYKKLLSTTALLFSISVANSSALPTGGVVQNGAATIANTSTKTTITQTTGRVDIDWSGFNVSSGQQVQFVQPNASAVAINRISGGATTIAGTLAANGRVVLINQSGVIITSSGRVNVGALVATTSNAAMEDSTNAPNSMTFFRTTKTPGQIRNDGIITVPAGGVVALLSPTVVNAGTINSPEGRVSLVGAEYSTVSLSSNPFVNYIVPNAKLDAYRVTNSGTINAKSGYVVMNAAQAIDVANSVLNLSGVVDVSAFSTTRNAGTFKAYSSGNLTSVADIKASAYAGSTRNGGNVELVAGNSLTVGNKIEANAGANGIGGNIILKSDDRNLTSKTGANDRKLTFSSGTIINAKGGTVSGRGGKIYVYSQSAAKTPNFQAAGSPVTGVAFNASPLVADQVSGEVRFDFDSGTDRIITCSDALGTC